MHHALYAIPAELEHVLFPSYLLLRALEACGGDWAAACEVFRRYDVDGSGRLDRAELFAALRDLNLLNSCSATAAGHALADMDTNGDGLVGQGPAVAGCLPLGKCRRASIFKQAHEHG